MGRSWRKNTLSGPARRCKGGHRNGGAVGSYAATVDRGSGKDGH